MAAGDAHRLGPLAPPVARRLARFEAIHLPNRLWAKDPTLWRDDPDTPEIRDRLGWLAVADAMAADAPQLAAFAADVRSRVERVVLCGMGGSSLTAEVLTRTFGAAPGFPSLVVLDSTDPRTVGAVARASPLERTLFIVASKSGTTLEADCFFRYFWQLTGARGPQFLAITDPDTPLATLATEHHFRRVFLNPPDIGGRYSALSYFGLVPAALLGLDVARLLERAREMARSSGERVAAADNPGAWLGAVLGEAVLAGRDKVTFVISPGIAAFGPWVEQLLAESTGKEGTGIVPVVGEPLGAPEAYGADRLFVALTLAGEEDREVEARLAALARAGHPLVRLTLGDRYDVGAEFFRWEFATATAGAVLRINAFDQPNVAESKANTNRVLEVGAAPSPARATRGDLERLLAAVRPGDYVAVMAYLPPTADHDRVFAALRARLRDRLRVATTVGYGPRYLHSTGQLHKGGPATGHFVQVLGRASDDLPIPGKPFTFGALEAAQAEGDVEALRRRGRPVLRTGDLALFDG